MATEKLFAAFSQNDLAVVKEVLLMQPDLVNARDQDISILELSLLVCQTPDIPLYLLEKGARAQDPFEALSSLVLRLEFADERLVKALIDAVGGAHIAFALTDTSPSASGDGWTVAHVCAAFGSPEMWRLLVQAGAKVDAVAQISLDVPLHAAAKEGNLIMRRVLIQEHGCRLRTPTNQEGLTPGDYVRMREYVLPSYSVDGFQLLTLSETLQTMSNFKNISADDLAALKPGFVVSLHARFHKESAEAKQSNQYQSNVALLQAQLRDSEVFQVGLVSCFEENNFHQGFIISACAQRNLLPRGLAIWFKSEHIHSITPLDI